MNYIFGVIGPKALWIRQFAKKLVQCSLHMHLFLTSNDDMKFNLEQKIAFCKRRKQIGLQPYIISVKFTVGRLPLAKFMWSGWWSHQLTCHFIILPFVIHSCHVWMLIKELNDWFLLKETCSENANGTDKIACACAETQIGGTYILYKGAEPFLR